MAVTTVRLQPEVAEGLDLMAGRMHRTRSWLINQALREFIQRQNQEQVRWEQTVQAMESVASGKVVPGEVVHEWLRSWGNSDELPPPKTDL